MRGAQFVNKFYWAKNLENKPCGESTSILSIWDIRVGVAFCHFEVWTFLFYKMYNDDWEGYSYPYSYALKEKLFSSVPLYMYNTSYSLGSTKVLCLCGAVKFLTQWLSFPALSAFWSFCTKTSSPNQDQNVLKANSWWWRLLLVIWVSSWPSGKLPFDCKKNCQKLDIFSIKLPNFFFYIQMAIFRISGGSAGELCSLFVYAVRCYFNGLIVNCYRIKGFERETSVI